MFRAADLIVINKCDLLEVLDDFDPAVARNYIRQLATEAPVLDVSAKSGAGVHDWTDWIRAEFSALPGATSDLQAAK